MVCSEVTSIWQLNLGDNKAICLQYSKMQSFSIWKRTLIWPTWKTTEIWYAIFSCLSFFIPHCLVLWLWLVLLQLTDFMVIIFITIPEFLNVFSVVLDMFWYRYILNISCINLLIKHLRESQKACLAIFKDFFLHFHLCGQPWHHELECFGFDCRLSDFLVSVCISFSHLGMLAAFDLSDFQSTLILFLTSSMTACPGRGLVVNIRKKCGEMWWNKIIFTAYFLHLFAVNAVNRGELFFFKAFSVFLQKKNRPHTGSILWAPACLQLLTPLPQLSLTTLAFLVNLNHIE